MWSTSALGEEDDRPVVSATRHLARVIERTFEENDVALPDRRVVVVGSVAVGEDPVLAVMFGQLSTGLPGNPMPPLAPYDTPRVMTFNIELHRREPSADSPTDPSAGRLQTSAELSMQDAWLLMESAYAADFSKRGVAASVSVIPPSGGMQGVSMSLEMMVV